MDNEKYVIEMLHICKGFGRGLINDDITLRLKKGEIHALLGENGAGKSTLMNVLFGIYSPDSGKILKDGKEIKIHSPNEASRYGIGMVHQHFMLIDKYTILENIILGEEPTKAGFLVKNDARQKVLDISNKYGLEINPDAVVANTTVGMQQRTEILKMLYRDNDVLIFDEPTAVLTPQEIDNFLKILKKLSAEGHTILFITHHLNEIMQVADRCTVISKGKHIGTVNICDTNEKELSTMMIGREVSLEVNKKPCVRGDKILSIDNLTLKNDVGASLENVSFDVFGGEIVCIAGIDGNGQGELVEAITGMRNADNGSIEFLGENITKKSIKYRSEHGISHIPEDRLKHAIVEKFNASQNLILQRYKDKEFSNRFGITKPKSIIAFADKLIKQFDIRLRNGAKTILEGVSGGNQQKLVVARELEKSPSLIVAVQPVRGVDIGAVEFIHNKLIEVRDSGKAVLLVSFDLNEVMNLADRILVMFKGKIVGELDPTKTDVNYLGFLMSGGSENGGDIVEK